MIDATLTVVLPCHNEEPNLRPLLDRLLPVLDSLDLRAWELVFIDDGSTDGTAALLDDLAAAHPGVRAIHFSRNFGHQAALSAGLDAATGDAVVLMDADLQDPPEVIPRLVERWREGFDVVYAIRQKRKEGLAMRFAYATFYRSLRALADVDTPLDAGDFCLLDRRIVEIIRSLPERNRFLRGLRSWAGFRQTGVVYERDPRHAGDSKYGFSQLLELALSGYVGFSVAPLRLAGILGLAASALGLFLAAYTIVIRLSGVPAPSGWASVFAAVLFVGGVQLLVLGVIGEYLGRVYDEVRDRPLYVVRSRVGFEPGEENGRG